MTPALLAVATAAVLGFGGLNVASALGWGSKARDVRNASSGLQGELAQVVLPVEGMTCVTCEWGIEKALGKLDGVVEAKASSSEHKVLVRYVPGKVSFEQMIEAVDSTGYKASMPDAS
jgi:copper chaperone CopZ